MQAPPIDSTFPVFTNPCRIGNSDAVNLQIGTGCPLAFIIGPCVIESKEALLKAASAIVKECSGLDIPLLFKSSFDKANRTAQKSFRGVGIEEGLRALEAVRSEFGLPVVTDVHSPVEAQAAGEVVDLVQVPAFLCRQTDLLNGVGAHAGAALIKKGQFLHPEDMFFAAQKVYSGGCSNILLCERGSCFGYRDLVVDMRGLAIMSALGLPVVFDGTHSVQIMGGKHGSSGGQRQFVPLLSRAAVAAGVDCLFIEAHSDPDSAPSDGANMLPINMLRTLIEKLHAIDELTRGA